jgi:DNA topoisomerase-1
VLKDRDYVKIDKKRLVPQDKGRIVVAFLENFFLRYVEFDFTASLEEQLDRISNHEIDWKEVLRDFWRDFIAAVDETKELRTSAVLDALNEYLGPHIFPAKEDGSDPRACPSCAAGQLSLKLGKFGAFIGCSNYPDCRYTRPLAANGDAIVGDEGTPGVKIIGTDPDTGVDVTLRDGRFGPYVQLGNGEKPKRQGLPRGFAPDAVDLEIALKLLSLPREVATHPTSGQPIKAGIGRFGPYVQHEKTYASLGKDDDVLEIGANRAIDLIVTKEQGGGRRFGRAADPGRELGADPETGETIRVKSGRYGPYVTDGTTNATLPNSAQLDAVTLDEALALISARRAKGPSVRPKRGRAARKAEADTMPVNAKSPPTKKAPPAKVAPAKKTAVIKAAPTKAAPAKTSARKAPPKKPAKARRKAPASKPAAKKKAARR